LPHVPSAPVPFFAAVQAVQVDVQAVSQQIPSCAGQCPLVHCAASVQGTPFAFFSVHWPEMQ
jgi:hypothetical protein